MSTSQNKRLVERYFEEISRGNLAILDELCAPELVHHTTHSPQPLHGLENVWPLTTSYHTAFPDLHYKVDHLVAEGDLVAFRWTAEGHHTGPFQGILPTGKHCVMSGMSIYRCMDGKIVERWVLNDDLGILGQFGVPRWMLAICVLLCVVPVYLYNSLKKTFSAFIKQTLKTDK